MSNNNYIIKIPYRTVFFLSNANCLLFKAFEYYMILGSICIISAKSNQGLFVEPFQKNVHMILCYKAKVVKVYI